MLSVVTRDFSKSINSGENHESRYCWVRVSNVWVRLDWVVRLRSFGARLSRDCEVGYG
jgi:hypothetical protein